MDTDLLKRKLLEVKSKVSQRDASDRQETTAGSVTDTSPLLHAKGVDREANKVPPAHGPAEGGLGVNGFTGLALSELLFVEIFAGTARLSKHAREAGSSSS